MPYEIEWRPKGPIKRFWGRVDAKSFLASITDAQSRPEYDEFRFSITDLSMVESWEISRLDVDTFAAYGIGASLTNKKIRVAMVTTSPEIIALVAHYATMAPFDVKCFPDMSQASLWAGAD